MSSEQPEKDAVEFATRAILFDQQNMFDAAIYYYRASAKSLSAALLLGSQLAGIQEKVDEYIRRAEELCKAKSKSFSVKVQKSDQQLQLERAEFLLKQGLDEDEAKNNEDAIELYFQAVELCISAKTKTSDDTLKAKLTKIAEYALDRAEILKTKKASTSPVKKPINTSPPSLDDLNISQRDVTSSSKSNIQFVNSSVEAGKFQVLCGNDSYSKDEIRVLRISSIINGREYVPFMSVDLKERFAYPLPFEDKHGKLVLSPKQKAVFGRWVRPENISSNPKVVELVDCFSIRQTVVSDCSFVASLAVCALFEKRFRKKILTSAIYPQNRHGDPVYNPCGKYMVKLNLNGIHRKIIVDDLFPMSSHGELLCSYSSNRNEFWVSILEKAYMKVMGGYDFPGSNSNIDLHALTGWIPERLSVEDSNFNKEHAFKMLLAHHRKGDLLITLATGDINEVEAERAGLVPTHAYALLDIQEVLGQRLFLVKNPWSHLRWKGKFSEHDTKSWTPELREALKYNPRNAQMFDNGVFWIDYSSICHFFSVIYLSWDPQMFKYTYCTHHSWNAGSGPVKDQYNIGENPQFTLDLKSKNSTVWILLTRHITDKDDFAENKEFIAVLVYKNDGRKVYYPYEPEPFIDGIRINSPHYLCKLIVPENGATRYTLVISQYEKSSTIFYTLRAYSTCPFRLAKIPNYFKYKHEIKNGSWTDANAGGCANNHATYHLNPVYQVTVESQSNENQLLVDLKGPKQFNVGFEVIAVTVDTNSPGYFERKSSGPFRNGFTILELHKVPPGVYNVIPATFHPGQKGPFFLTFQSSCPIHVKRLK